MTNDSPSVSSASTNKTKVCTVLPKSSIISVVCRICYDSDKEEDLITPCNCKGTVAFVHRACLETWLGESNTTTCELCHQVFKTERIPKYTSRQSIWHWCRSSPIAVSQAVRSDILACTVITPLAVVITYVCLFSSEYYNQKKFSNVPAARWTSVSLLIMIGIMLIGYYLWVYSVIRMHARIWYNWWQRSCNVTYIPPSETEIPNPEIENNPDDPFHNIIIQAASGLQKQVIASRGNSFNQIIKTSAHEDCNHEQFEIANQNNENIV